MHFRLEMLYGLGVLLGTISIVYFLLLKLDTSNKSITATAYKEMYKKTLWISTTVWLIAAIWTGVVADNDRSNPQGILDTDVGSLSYEESDSDKEHAKLRDRGKDLQREGQDDLENFRKDFLKKDK